MTILSIVLFFFLSVSANAEDHPHSTDTAEVSTALEVISLEVNSAIWPCFPNHFFLEETSISDVFAFTDYINVEVTDHAEFLSDRIWARTCEEIQAIANPPTGTELLNIGRVYEFEPATAKVELEDFLSLPVSIEIWMVIAKELEASQRFVEAFIVTSNTVIFTYKHTALCSLNIELRERFPALCNYLELRELMASSWANYNTFIEVYEPNIPSAGMRASLHGSASLAYEQSILIPNWE